MKCTWWNSRQTGLFLHLTVLFLSSEEVGLGVVFGDPGRLGSAPTSEGWESALPLAWMWHTRGAGAWLGGGTGHGPALLPFPLEPEPSMGGKRLGEQLDQCFSDLLTEPWCWQGPRAAWDGGWHPAATAAPVL